MDYFYHKKNKTKQCFTLTVGFIEQEVFQRYNEDLLVTNDRLEPMPWQTAPPGRETLVFYLVSYSQRKGVTFDLDSRGG